MDITQLEKIGLKEKEAIVYLALLKEGPSIANHIAKKTSILRSSIYDYLDILLDKGFISYIIKSGKKFFQAVQPESLIDNFNERKQEEERALKELLPQLSALQNIAEKKAVVEVFEGKEGMKTVLSRVLRENPKEFLAYGSSGVSYKLLPYFMKHWHEQRIKQKMLLRVIYNDSPETKERLKFGPPLKYCEAKFLPIKHFSLTGTIIYNDKVVLTMWSTENPIAVSIESDQMSRDYKDNFEVLWKISKSFKKN